MLDCKICGKPIPFNRRLYCGDKCQRKNTSVNFADYKKRWLYRKRDRLALKLKLDKVECPSCKPPRYYKNLYRHLWSRHQTIAGNGQEVVVIDLPKAAS